MPNSQQQSNQGMGPAPDFEQLRNGVILEGRLKLIERVPRWLSQRRFRARTTDSDEELMLLFFDIDAATLAAWQERIARLRALPSRGLLPVQEAGEIQGFRYVTADWVPGVPFLDQLNFGGPLTAQDAREAAAAMLAAAGCLLQAQVDLPGALAECVLLAERAGTAPAMLFPLRPPWLPAADNPDAVARALRDLLFQAASGQFEAPRSFGPAELARLPEAAARVWAGAMVDTPALDDVARALQNSLGGQTALPPPRTGRPAAGTTPPATASARGTQPGFTPPAFAVRDPQLAGKPAPEFLRPAVQVRTFDWWRAVSTVAAVALAGFVAWFAVAVATELAPPPPPPKPQILQIPGRPPNLAQPVPRPAIPADAASPADPKTWPAALAGFAAELQAQPGNPETERRLAQLLEQMQPETDSIRASLRPGVLEGLEAVAAAGSPAGRLLLAQVLWGRETGRAEKLAIELAREGYPEARIWCAAKFIDWE